MLEGPAAMQGGKWTLAAVVGATGLNKQRVGEALLIAIITSVASAVVTVRILDERTTEMTKRMDKFEERQERRYETLQGDLQRIYVVLAELRLRPPQR